MRIGIGAGEPFVALLKLINATKVAPFLFALTGMFINGTQTPATADQMCNAQKVVALCIWSTPNHMALHNNLLKQSRIVVGELQSPYLAVQFVQPNYALLMACGSYKF